MWHQDGWVTEMRLLGVLSHTALTKEDNMKTASLIARYLLGLIFSVLGLNGFLNFLHLPGPTGVAAQFFGAIFVSHFYIVIFLLQIVPALLLMANRYVPLALTILGPIIFNIVCIHAFMAPAGLPLAVFVTVLWIVVAYSVRSAFSGILVAGIVKGEEQNAQSI
jgi:putative oxidoreductase